MTNIFENDFNKNKSLSKSLETIYGLGKPSIKLLCKLTGIGSHQKLDDLEPDQLEFITKQMSYKKFIINQELKKNRKLNLEKLVEIKSYRGIRRIKGYPIRGQRTRSNAKTARKKLFK